jgi:GNAT superfamily N-acetyltransferase
MTGIRIVKAEQKDIGDILAMIKELAEFENLLDQVVATEALLQRTLFCAHPHAKALLIEADGKRIGFAIFFYNFSTFLGQYGLYIEDLYIREAYRGKGYATEVLRYLSRLAIEENCGRIEWWVLDWNESAINFYKKIGAVPMDEWTVFRLRDDAIKRLAESRKS